uniref:Uncharacterized protein LOC117347077 isoform X2 n=1 Tax=Geotrypetes seraphini TaxID=260995 RepID=A0A6P8PEZ5_GEOSA|nr:uncharacterized protein LOC117347077 isoform X2 [Geotrypetes seraphini]
MASAPVPCPPGTYGNRSLAKHSTECYSCPAGTFNHLFGQKACFPCGSSSFSQTGATSCHCRGQNRAFQESDGSCICLAGFVYYDERGKEYSDGNSDLDCHPQVEERCALIEARLASTRKCVVPEQYDCIPFCGQFGGELSPELGICHCKQYISAEELCDRFCLMEAPQVSLNVGFNREFQLHFKWGKQKSSMEMEVLRVLGPEEHIWNSERVLFVLFGPNGVFGLIPSNVQVLEAFLTDSWSVSSTRKHYKLKKSSSFWNTSSLPLIPNPVVCLKEGDVILFQLSIFPENRSASHYPVYQKQHLYNSNTKWDFGVFRRLDHLIRETQLNISRFAHVFQHSGRYVFTDNGIENHMLFVIVNGNNIECDSTVAPFQPSSPFQLVRHGILKHQKLNLSPNWTSISGVLLLLGLLMALLLILAVLLRTILLRPSPMKSWKPRWRSLGEPYIPPEYVLTRDSFEYYEALGPRGSGGGEDAGKNETAYGSEKKLSVLDLEDFNVRTLYDKLEDQNLHLASQLGRHRNDTLAFYKGISQHVQILKNVIQGLDVNRLKENLGKSKKTADKMHGSLNDVICPGQSDKAMSNNRDLQNWNQLTSVDAYRQEAAELMKALKFLVLNIHSGRIAVKREQTQKLTRQDAMAEFSDGSLQKSRAEQNTISSLFHQQKCYEVKNSGGLDLQLPGTLLTLSGEAELERLIKCSPLAQTLQEIKEALKIHLSQENHININESGSREHALVPLGLGSLTPRQLVVFRFGCALVHLLCRTYSLWPLVLQLAQRIPYQGTAHFKSELTAGYFYYDAASQFLYIHAAQLDDVGRFSVTIVTAMAQIKAGCTIRSDHADFLKQLNDAIMDLAKALFHSSWTGAHIKKKEQENCSSHINGCSVFRDLLSVYISPHPEFTKESRHARQKNYKVFQLQMEIQDMMKTSRKSEHGKWSEGDLRTEVMIARTKLEDELDQLNEDFFQLTKQALKDKKEAELLDRIWEDSFLKLKAPFREADSALREQLEARVRRKDQALLLEIRRHCVAERINNVEGELSLLLQGKNRYSNTQPSKEKKNQM